MAEKQIHRAGDRFFEVTYDDSGNQIGAKEISAKEALGQDIGTPVARPQNWQDTFRNSPLAPILQGSLVNLGRGAGATAAAPAAAATANPLTAAGLVTLGTAGGGMAGDQVYQLLQKLSPRTFGSGPETLGESVKQSALNTALDVGIGKVTTPIANRIGNELGGLLTKGGRENLTGRILQKLFPVDPNIPVQESLRNTPLNFDVAQATQNTKARIIRDALAHDKTLQEFASQQPQLKADAESILTNYLGKPQGIQEMVDPFTNPYYQKQFNAALATPGNAKMFVALNPGSKSELGTEYMRRLLASAQDENGQFTGAEASLNKFYKTQDLAKEVLNNKTRESFEYFLRRAQATDPSLVTTGQVALGVRGLNAGVSIGSGLLSTMLTQNPNYKIMLGAGTFLGTLNLSKKMVRDIFFNPQYARMAARLTSLPPQSSEAQFLMRSLFKGPLKAAQFETQYGPMIVNSDGKLEPMQ